LLSAILGGLQDIVVDEERDDGKRLARRRTG
jgi:hypothetical protein